MQKKFLIADDDQELCEELAEMLKMKGYDVDSVFDGLSCEEKFKQNKYDIVILDYKMPGLNGIELLKIIKRSEPKTKVLIISGNHNIKDMLKVDNALDFVGGFLSKPFDVEEFLEKIKQIV